MRTATRTTAAVFVVVMAAATTSRSESKTARAAEHLRKACELIWENATSYKIEHCTKRAMAALGEEDRLRDNELKRLLIASERELDRCQAALGRARADVATARRDPNR